MIRIGAAPRLFESDEAPRELRDWLRRAQRDTLSATEAAWLVNAAYARAAGSAQPRIGPGSSAKSMVARSARPAVWAEAGHWSARLLIGLAAAPGLGLAGWLWLRQPAAPPWGDASSVAVSPESFASVAGAIGSSPPSPAAEPEELAVEELAPALSSAEVRGRARKARRHAVTGRGSGASTIPGPTNTETPAPSAQLATRSEEYRILVAARQAFPNSPAAALALTQEHFQKFPRGILGQERETIAIEALARLGRIGEAKARAQSCLSRFPASPYRTRIEAAVSHSGKLESVR